MAKFVKPLTETQIKNSKPRATPYSDGNNLYLFVRPAVRSFVFLYTHPTTKKRIKKKIGEHPHLSLAEAREIARGYSQLLAKGFDPFEYAEQQAKEQMRQGITLAEFAEQWKRLKLATQENSSATMAREWRRLEKHLFPAFGDRPLKELAIFELVDYFLPLYEVKGDTVEASELMGETQQKAVMRYLFEQFEKRINTESKLDETLTLSSPVLADFSPKSPTQKHLESFNQNPKGFAALFQNLQ